MLCDIPSPEAVTCNEDDSYTVFINKNLTFEHQQEAFFHALKHIYREDFYKDNACQMEAMTHRLTGYDKKLIELKMANCI